MWKECTIAVLATVIAMVLFCAAMELQIERQAAADGYIKIDGKVFHLVPLE